MTAASRSRLTVSLLIVLLAAVGGATWYLGRRPESLPQFTQRRLTANPQDLPVNYAAISPDGKYLGYSDQNGIHLQILGTGEAQTIPMPPGVPEWQGYWYFDSWYPDSTRFLASLGVLGQGASFWSVPILGGAPRKIADGLESLGAVSPDGSYIAYMDQEGGDGYRSIWLMGPQGEAPHKILTAGDQSGFYDVRWSPAGNRIGYARMLRQGNNRLVSLESCDLNGSGKTEILSDIQLCDFAWVSRWRLVYSRGMQLSGTPAFNLWEVKVDRDTGAARGAPRRLTDWSGFMVWGLSATADERHPLGNEKKLAFLRGTGHQSVFVGDLANNGTRLVNTRRLTADEYINQPAAWTADSREVFFASNRGGAFGVYRQALGETAPQMVATSLDPDAGWFRISPDGSWLVFAARPHGAPAETQRILYRVSVAGGAPQSLFEVKGFNDLRCTSRMANLCVVGSRSEDQRELILTPFDPIAGKGKELLRIPIEPGGDYHWALAPDGAEVAYLKKHWASDQVHFIPLRGGETRTVTLTGHFLLSSVEWAPDSRSLFIGSQRATGSDLLHVDLKGSVEPIWQAAQSDTIWGVPSPDGKHIAMMGSSANANVWLIENF